jgi:membrane-associated phospholipid phosphatase
MMHACARWLCVAMWLSLLAPLGTFDQRLQEMIQTSRRPALEPPMRFLSRACNGTTLCAGLLAVALFDPLYGIETAKTALLVLAPTNAVVEGIKRVTDRTRPDGEQKPSNASFPSSHAANIFALAIVLGRRWRRALPLFLLVALAVGYSRVYLDRHWVSDVVVGAAIGAGTAWWVARWREGRLRRRAAAGAPAAMGESSGTGA